MYIGIREFSLRILLPSMQWRLPHSRNTQNTIRIGSRSQRTWPIPQYFVTRKEELAKILSTLRKKLSSDATLWISWPKQSAKVPTTITDNTIRELALPPGFVDIKVCAITEVWSGLKLVVRKELR
jgi:hypothetical protein